MVYKGPGIISKINNELIQIAKKNGVKNILELKGTK